MAGGKSLQFSRKHHWPGFGEENLLVFRHNFHLHFVYELGGIDSRGRDHWMGTSRPDDRRISCGSAAATRGKRGPQYDLRNGGGVFHFVGCLGGASEWDRRRDQTFVCSQRRGLWSIENPDGDHFLSCRLARNRFDLIPADFAELPFIRQYLCR